MKVGMSGGEASMKVGMRGGGASMKVGGLMGKGLA